MVQVIENDGRAKVLYKEEKQELQNLTSRIFKVLLDKPEIVVTYGHIIREVWGRHYHEDESIRNRVRVHMHKIRKFLQEKEVGVTILPMPKVGFILVEA